MLTLKDKYARIPKVGEPSARFDQKEWLYVQFGLISESESTASWSVEVIDFAGGRPSDVLSNVVYMSDEDNGQSYYGLVGYLKGVRTVEITEREFLERVNDEIFKLVAQQVVRREEVFNLTFLNLVERTTLLRYLIARARTDVQLVAQSITINDVNVQVI